MRFIKLKEGSNIRADTITAVRLCDPRAADKNSSELKPRVVVDFGQGGYRNSIVLYCETIEERNALSDSIMAEIGEANG